MSMDKGKVSDSILGIELVQKQHFASANSGSQSLQGFLAATSGRTQGQFSKQGLGPHCGAHGLRICQADGVERSVEIPHAGARPACPGMPEEIEFAHHRPVPPAVRADLDTEHSFVQRGGEIGVTIINAHRKKTFWPFPSLNKCVTALPIELVPPLSGE